MSLGDSSFFYCQDDSESKKKIISLVSAAGAGVVFNIANVGITAAVQIVGLSIAFPIAVGVALVVGTVRSVGARSARIPIISLFSCFNCVTKIRRTSIASLPHTARKLDNDENLEEARTQVLTYIVDPTGKASLLFAGLTLAVFAVIATAIAGKLKDGKDQAVEDQRLIDGLLEDPHTQDEQKNNTNNFTKGVITSLISGVLMSLWSPLNALALADLNKSCEENQGKLTAYSSFLIFTFSIVLSSMLILCPLVLKYPVDGKPATSLAKCLSLRHFSYHTIGLFGGVIWALGTLSNSISGMKLGLALSYAIGQAAPMVATTWGLLYYKEYVGAPRSSFVSLFFMYVFYLGAISLVALSK